MSLPPRPDDDPRPEPPVCPDNDDCCHSGCDPCIFDLYDEEFGRYRAALAAWEAREAERQAQAKGPRKRAAKPPSPSAAPPRSKPPR
ncbi:oxidoreductase family protein [Paraburkholderia silvatlantica]|uniref:Oxidoreductase family protein n=1 Tax=Paraburkholderia silvatlantica TaxID=321895 RepID=A0A2V4UHR5_9BURK|nr:oxidoreductase-like domain-containing protein [Paraburkholderia silvatlantica]PYE27470.1 oxidoreductase family protein [Paraburkholderia silvatlantica]